MREANAYTIPVVTRDAGLRIWIERSLRETCLAAYRAEVGSAVRVLG